MQLRNEKGELIPFDLKKDEYEPYNGNTQRKFSPKGFMNKVLSGQLIIDNQASKGLTAQMNNPDRLSLQEKQAIELVGGEIGKDGFNTLNK